MKAGFDRCHTISASDIRKDILARMQGLPLSQANKALPTEAEWEYAARGGLMGADFAWGDEFTPGGTHLANLSHPAEFNAALRRYPWIDHDRLGIEGTSYGGQLSAWLITQTNIFKAAIPTAAITNLISYNYMTYYNQYEQMEWGVFPHQGNLMDTLLARVDGDRAKAAGDSATFKAATELSGGTQDIYAVISTEAAKPLTALAPQLMLAMPILEQNMRCFLDGNLKGMVNVVRAAS